MKIISFMILLAIAGLIVDCLIFGRAAFVFLT
jgi:hypothetical protein